MEKEFICYLVLLIWYGEIIRGHLDHQSDSHVKVLPCVLRHGLLRYVGFPDGSVVKNLPATAGDTGSIPVSGRCPREGNGNPLQYSCLGNCMDRGPWRATVHGIAKELFTI